MLALAALIVRDEDADNMAAAFEVCLPVAANGHVATVNTGHMHQLQLTLIFLLLTISECQI